MLLRRLMLIKFVRLLLTEGKEHTFSLASNNLGTENPKPKIVDK